MTPADPKELLAQTAGLVQPTPSIKPASGADPRELLKLTEPFIAPADPKQLLQESAPLVEGAPPLADTGEDIRRGIVKGLKQSIAPWAMSEREYAAKTDTAGTIAEMIANLSGSLGVTAGLGATISAAAKAGGLTGAALGPAGAALGAVGAGTMAAIAYGIYAGIGDEYLRSRHEGQDFDPLRATGRAAMEVNPLIKGGDKLVRALRIGAQVAGAGAVEYSYAKDTADAGTAAALAVIAASPLALGMRPDRVLPSPEAAQAVLKSLSDLSGDGLASRAIRRIREEVPKIDIDLSDQAFRRELVGAGADVESALLDAKFKTVWDKLSPERQRDAWDLHQSGRILVEEAEKSAVERIAKLAPDQAVKEPTGRIGRMFKDMKFVANDVDEKTGQNLAGTLDRLSTSKDAFSLAANGLYEEALKAQKVLAKLPGVTEDDIGKALAGRWDLLSKDVANKLKSAEGQSAVVKWRGVWDAAAAEMKARGYTPGRLDEYLPTKALSGADLSLALNTRLSDLKALALAKKATDLSQLAGEPKYDELVKFAAERLGRDPSTITQRDLIQLPKSVLHANLKERAGYTASALFSRGDGEIPDAMRNWKVGDLFVQYVNNNLKATFMREGFQRLEHNARALDALGMTETAKFFREHAKLISGERAGLVAKLGMWAEDMRYFGKKMEQAGGVPGKVGGTIAAIPDFLGWTNGLVYPAYLGTNFKATARNLTQMWTTTAPELGPYGYGLIGRTLLQYAPESAKLRFSGINTLLASKNQLGGLARSERVIEAASLPGRLKSKLDFVNDFAMLAYTKTDEINRYISLRAGARWAQDIAEGRADAIKALRKMQRGAREELLPQINDLVAKGEKGVEELGDMLGDYLISKTQFRYGKEQLSRFGQLMGPAFSMFTKWPVMVGSDMVNTLRHRPTMEAALTLASKYFAPYAALAAAQQVIEQNAELGTNPIWEAIVGDVRDISPLKSVGGWDITGGPLVKALAKTPGTVARALSGEGDTVAKSWTREFIKGYLPPVSSVLNELDRWKRAQGRTTTSTEAVNQTFRWLEDMYKD